MKDVLISIKGLQGYAEDGEDIEFVTEGTYEYSPEETKFFYMESELTGLEGTRTEFSVTRDRVVITREGTVAMQMIFTEGERNYFAYQTPFGSMTMSVHTQSILEKLSDEGGELEVRYLMDLGNSIITRNRFEINIR